MERAVTEEESERDLWRSQTRSERRRNEAMSWIEQMRETLESAKPKEHA
jgi:hypothetical protein